MENLSKFQIWMIAIRPHTLPAAVGPVLVGVAFASSAGVLRPLPSLAALVGALLLQILSNLGNDYYDFVKGVDTEERVGPLRVAQSGLLPLSELRNGILLNIFLAVLDGLYLLYVVSSYEVNGVSGVIIILGIGVLSIIFALLYSGGPFPLSSLGLGDVFVLIFFGIFAVNGSYFVNSGSFSFAVLVGSLGPGLLITAILVVNNYRDYESDKKTGKRTLVVMFGKKFGQVEYVVLLFSAYLVPFLLFISYGSSPFVFLPLLSLPLAVKNVSVMNERTSRVELIKTLGSTAKLSLVYSILLSLGILF